MSDVVGKNSSQIAWAHHTLRMHKNHNIFTLLHLMIIYEKFVFS